LRSLNAPVLAALALLSAALDFPFLPALRVQSKTFLLEVSLSSTKAGNVQVYWDDGSGLSERNSSILPVPAGAAPASYRLAVPLGVYSWIRFDPIDNDGTVVVYSARIIDDIGKTIRNVGLGDFSSLNQIQSLSVVNEGLEIRVVPGGSDPQLRLTFEPLLRIRYDMAAVGRQWAGRTAAVFAFLAAILLGLGRADGMKASLSRAARELLKRPKCAVACISALAVMVSAYPVVFAGKSYVAPNTWDIHLLYDGRTTLPGYHPNFVTDEKGSDIGAIFWQHIPLSMIEHRAIFRDHEWPLWNRYDSGGSPLLGQGQSMVGNPLHLLVQAANGSAWAWDCDYLAEKWLLAVGLGFLVLSATGRTISALIVSTAAPFFGFFIYRLNHPAFFSLCAAPWPLYCWMRVSASRSLRSAAIWAAALVLANITLMDSGTVKEAYMLLLAMNFSGLCVLLAAAGPWGPILRKLAVVSWALSLFAIISAPVWMTFLTTLRDSYTSYDAASAFQIQPSLLMGAFDEAFYRPLTPGSNVFNPSANFLILAGVLYFLATLRSHFGNRTVMALAASACVPLALAFGLVPPMWIEQVPLLRNVAHIDNCFSCALIILWSAIAGAGFSAAADRLGASEGKADLAVAGLLLSALVFHYLAFGQAVHRVVLAAQPVFSAQGLGGAMQLGRFAGIYLATLIVALVGIGLLMRRCLRTGLLTGGAAIGLILCASLLLWRQGLQPPSEAFGEYSVRPGPRPDFHAASAAMERMRGRQASEPSRGVGLESSFFPGWSAVYGLEGISGPDALMSPFYRELTGVSPITRVWDWRLNLTRAAIPASRPFLDFMNVRYYFGMPGDGPLDSGLTLDAQEDLSTYESPTAWPRAFFTDRLAIYDDPADLMGQILKGDGRPFAAIQAKDSGTESVPSLSPSLGGRSYSPASRYVLTERTTSFSVHASGPGVAVLSEVYWPGYSRAKVNGVEAKVIRLNHAFQGVAIGNAGDYRVTFDYEPRDFGKSMALAAAGLGLLIISGIAVLRRKPIEEGASRW
jgi:hypothetical protein